MKPGPRCAACGELGHTRRSKNCRLNQPPPGPDGYWIEQGRIWAREDVLKEKKLARIQKPGFDAEGAAAEYRTDVITEEESERGEGWLEVQYGYRTELEKLTGLKFPDYTSVPMEEKIRRAKR